MAAHELYYFESSVLQTPKMVTVKIVKWIIVWKTYILLTLCRTPSQLQVFLVAAGFELDGLTSHKHGLAAKYSFKMAACKVEFWAFFRHFRGFVEWETSLSGKA